MAPVPFKQGHAFFLNDIDAIENAVGMNLSNGFVEGTNSKTMRIGHTG